MKYLFHGQAVRVLSVTVRQEYTDIGNAYPVMIPAKKKRIALVECPDGTRTEIDMFDLECHGVAIQ